VASLSLSLSLNIKSLLLIFFSPLADASHQQVVAVVVVVDVVDVVDVVGIRILIFGRSLVLCSHSSLGASFANYYEMQEMFAKSSYNLMLHNCKSRCDLPFIFSFMLEMGAVLFPVLLPHSIWTKYNIFLEIYTVDKFVDISLGSVYKKIFKIFGIK